MAYLVTYRPVPGFSNLSRTAASLEAQIDNPKQERVEADYLFNENHWLRFQREISTVPYREEVLLLASDAVLSVAKV